MSSKSYFENHVIKLSWFGQGHHEQVILTVLHSNANKSVAILSVMVIIWIY